MKIATIQPEYPSTYEMTLDVMQYMKTAVGNCPGDIDLIVLPEYSNCPGMSDMDAMKKHCRIHNSAFLEFFSEAAEKTNTAICVNMLFERTAGFTNTTFFIDKSGIIIAEYDKTHLAYTEINPMNLIPGNTSVFVDFMDTRFTFAVCFELYFPEYFESLAIQSPDIILCPSYQRSENSGILLKQAMGRALDSEAYILRSSYSMGSNSQTGGCTYVVDPAGKVLLNAEQKTGIFILDINPAVKRMRPLAHGLNKMSSRKIIEEFRIPALYRNNATGRKPLSEFRYPRVCAHRGHSGLVPENTLPAFSSALVIGADEIEFDVRLTKDGKMIVCHDGTVDRVSNGTGNVSDFLFDDIRKLNAGEYMGWTDIRFATPEEIFKHLGGRIIMNIHIYEPGKDGCVIKKLSSLIEKYDIGNYVYFAAQEDVMAWCVKLAPRIERCMLECFNENRDIVDIALDYDCRRAQHFYRVYSPNTVKKAKKAGLISNLFYEDNPDLVESRLRDGIDTILANFADKIIPVVKK